MEREVYRESMRTSNARIGRDECTYTRLEEIYGQLGLVIDQFQRDKTIGPLAALSNWQPLQELLEMLKTNIDVEMRALIQEGEGKDAQWAV